MVSTTVDVTVGGIKQLHKAATDLCLDKGDSINVRVYATRLGVVCSIVCPDILDDGFQQHVCYSPTCLLSCLFELSRLYLCFRRNILACDTQTDTTPVCAFTYRYHTNSAPDPACARFRLAVILNVTLVPSARLYGGVSLSSLCARPARPRMG